MRHPFAITNILSQTFLSHKSVSSLAIMALKLDGTKATHKKTPPALRQTEFLGDLMS